MRSRPDLTLFLMPRAPAAGERLVAKIRLDVRTETPCDGIDVVLIGRERRYRNTTSTGKTTVQHYHRREVLRLGGRLLPGTLRPGVQEREIAFDIPVDAPPSYRSALARVEYELDVRVHIPWWPDRHERYDVQVLAPRDDGARGAARVLTNVTGEHRGEGIAMELSLAEDVIRPGGTIRGALAVTGLHGKSLRRVELACVTVETARVYSAAGPSETDRRVWVLREGTPGEGEAMPFALQVPNDLVTSFDSPFINVSHALEATAVVAWGSDVAVRVPVRVVRGSEASAAEGVPIVGRARNLAVWREAVQQVRIPGAELVRFDPEAAQVVFSVRGLRVVAREETRDDLPCLVAEIAYPPLGLDLRVAERRWTDLGARVAGVDESLQQRFTVRAREAAQAAALLDPSLGAMLSAFDEAALDDAQATVARAGGVFQLSGLQRFLLQVQSLASALADASARVPPPSAVASSLDAWRAFALARGASLRVGDLSLHGWVVKGVPLRLSRRWSGAPPRGVSLEADLPEGADLARCWAALSEAPPGVARVEGGLASWELGEVNDPAAVVGHAEAFAEAILRAQRGGDAGPYRA